MVKENLEIAGYNLTIEQSEAVPNEKTEEVKAFLTNLFKAILTDLKALGFQRQFSAAINGRKIGDGPLHCVWEAKLQPNDDDWLKAPTSSLSSIPFGCYAEYQTKPRENELYWDIHITTVIPYIQSWDQNEELVADPAQDAIMKIIYCNFTQQHSKRYQSHNIMYDQLAL